MRGKSRVSPAAVAALCLLTGCAKTTSPPAGGGGAPERPTSLAGLDPAKLYLVVQGSEASEVEAMWVVFGNSPELSRIEGAFHVSELTPVLACPNPGECKPCQPAAARGTVAECPWPPPPIRTPIFKRLSLGEAPAQ